MKAEERIVSQILTENIRYEVPPYQRPYSWTKDNTLQLLDDVHEAFLENEKEYFIGSLITIEREKDQRYEVVDGQQRLTTMNLILAKLREFIEDERVKSDIEKRLMPRNVYTDEAEAPRLTLRRQDQKFFEKTALRGEPPTDISILPEPQLRIVENLEEIARFLNGWNQTELKRYANYMLQNVYVVLVRTETFASAYRLFNVLNARGLSLSNADLVKNLLFSRAGDDEYEKKHIDETWSELEEVLGIDEMDSFLSHHRTSITGTEVEKSLSDEYGALLDESSVKTSQFCDTLLQSARNYSKIIGEDFPEGRQLRLITSLNSISYKDWVAPLLAFMNNSVADINMVNFLGLIDKVTMQNWVRRLGRKARTRVYYRIITSILRKGTGEEIRQIVRDAANNEEFLSLIDGDLYGLPSAYAILLRLEQESQDESVTKIFSGRITIEHILPQTMKDQYWKDRFTNETHRLWVHRLGNLTLLSGNKNSAAQYYSFPIKKQIYEKKNQKVSFDMTKEICLAEDWTEDVLQRRQNHLIEQARKTWEIL